MLVPVYACESRLHALYDRLVFARTNGDSCLNLGVPGLYLRSIFLELKHRPAFVVEQTTFEAAGAPV